MRRWPAALSPLAPVSPAGPGPPVWAPAARPPAPRPPRHTVERLRVGMSRAEVHALLGEPGLVVKSGMPPGTSEEVWDGPESRMESPPSWAAGSAPFYWVGPDPVFMVTFDGAGAVVDKTA